MANPLLDSYRQQLQTRTPQPAKPQQEGGVMGFLKGIVSPFVETGKNLYQSATSVGSGLALDQGTEMATKLNKQRSAYIDTLKPEDFDRPEVKAKLDAMAAQPNALGKQSAKISQSKEFKDVQSIDRTKAAANAADVALTLGSLGIGGLAKTGAKAAGTGLLKTVAKGAGEGAVFGGAYGGLSPLKEKGAGATAEDVLSSATSGAVTGGITGGVLSGGSKIIGDIAQNNIQKGGILSKVSSAGKNVKAKLQDKAATSMLKLTPSQSQKLLDAGVDPTRLAQTAAKYGKNSAEIIGKTGKSGPLQQAIRELEDGIQTTVNTAGNNIKIDAGTIISKLKQEASSIKKELGGGARLKQINNIIADAEKKYKSGVTVKQALSTLRQANEKFGKAVLDDSGDAIVTAAQKLEGNTLRSLLKERFPSIADGLDSQSELIQLREILSRARGVEKTGSFKLNQFDITKPGTLVNPIVNSGTVSQKILGGVSKGGVQDGISSPKASSGLIGIIKSINQPGVINAIKNQAVGRLSVPATPSVAPETAPITTPELTTPTATAEATPTSSLDNIFGNQQIIQTLILDDFQKTGGKNIASIKTLYDMFKPSTKAATSSFSKPTASQYVQAKTGMSSLDSLVSLIESNSDIVAKNATPGQNIPIIGSVISNLAGTGKYRALTKNILNSIARINTGANMPESEQYFYEQTYLPQPGDNEQTSAQKISNLYEFFDPLANYQSYSNGSQDQLTDAITNLVQ